MSLLKGVLIVYFRVSLLLSVLSVLIVECPYFRVSLLLSVLISGLLSVLRKVISAKIGAMN